MVTDSGTYKQTNSKDLIFAQRSFFVFLPPHKWHIWFCPTHTPTLRKTKRATFYQRSKKYKNHFKLYYEQKKQPF